MPTGTATTAGSAAVPPLVGGLNHDPELAANRNHLFRLFLRRSPPTGGASAHRTTRTRPHTGGSSAR